jgi:hypothetical protein
MSWVKIDDQMPRHPKLLGLGRDRLMCQGVWMDGMCYASAYLTDGVIPAAALEKGSERYAQLLVTAGLWEKIDGGYRVHDYHDYQPTRATVMESRRRNAERQSRYRNGASNGVTNEATNAVSTDAPARTRPVPGPQPVPEVLSNVLGNPSDEWVEPGHLYATRARRRQLSKKELDWIEDLHVRFSRTELVAALRAVEPGPDYRKRVDAYLEHGAAAE